MGFIIKPFQTTERFLVYPHNQLRKDEKFVEADYLFDYNGNAVVDDERKLCLIPLPYRYQYDDRSGRCAMYAFGRRDGVAILKDEGNCVFSFLYISAPLKSRLDEVKDQIREAFKVGGLAFDETSAKDELFAVPHAEFKQ